MMQNLIGQTIGAYVILEPIDDGGVANVYLAKSSKNGKLVALKLMKPEAVRTEKLRERFLQEATIMETLRHPHIMKLLETGSHQDQPFIAMQYAAGGSLANQTDKLSLHDIARLLKQLGSALDYAHARNTIHRDIKLENVLLDEQNNALLIDFGMAKSLEANGDALATGTGVILGTPYYLSPEQCLFQPVDARSDVYSLGVLVYVLLTGEFPFTGRAPAAVMMRHVQEAPALVSSIRTELAPEIAQVVDKALKKAPEERYQSAGEFAEAFAVATGHKTEITQNEVAKKAVPPALILGGLVLVVAIVAVSFFFLLSAVPQ
jgi:eukaryotic-like serine/threonine-protein kinase